MAFSLPKAWFACAVIAFVAHLVIAIPVIASPFEGLVFVYIFSGFSAGIYLITLGLIYFVFLRVSQDPVIVWIGWAHLGLSILGNILGLYINYARVSWTADPAIIEPQTLAYIGGIKAVISFIALILFLAVAIRMALQMRKQINLSDFD